MRSLVHRAIGALRRALVAALIGTCAQAADVPGLNAAVPPGSERIGAPRLAEWTHQGGGIGYLFAGMLRLDTPGAPPRSQLAVGAQLNAYATRDTHQIVFGVAAEAWALPGSHSMLTGIEATTINMEPANPWHKIAFWATYKTRADAQYFDLPADPGNLNAQALRIESQPGTGFERGIVLAPNSLHASRAQSRPILIDLREVPPEKLANWDLIAFPDGCRLRYGGNGRLDVVCPP